MNDRVVVLIPEAPAPAAKSAAPEAPRLTGDKLRIGLLDNGKGNADHLLRLLLERLQGELAIDAVVTIRKASVSLPAAPEILDRFAAETDFVVTAMAD
jgi:hypothetical protein